MFLNIFVLKNKDMSLKIDKVTLQFEIKPNYDANYSSIYFSLYGEEFPKP